MSMDVDAEFHRGELAAISAQHLFDRDTAGPAMTTINSWWKHLTCECCGHTFRRGDRVHVDPRQRTVHHLDPGIGCDGAEKEAEPPEVAEFAAGVLAAWPPVSGVEVLALTEHDWHVRRPAAPMRRARCLVCAHTFRSGEHVVMCPCSPGRSICESAVHRDPAVGLVCWESWRPDGRVAACPVTLTRREG